MTRAPSGHIIDEPPNNLQTKVRTVARPDSANEGPGYVLHQPYISRKR